MKWIKASDRLPENTEEVLVYAGNEGKYVSSLCFNNHDNTFCTDEWIVCDGITHWMPFPTPPQEEQPRTQLELEIIDACKSDKAREFIEKYKDKLNARFYGNSTDHCIWLDCIYYSKSSLEDETKIIGKSTTTENWEIIVIDLQEEGLV